MRVGVLLIFGITGLNICLLAQETPWELHVGRGLALRAQGLYHAAESEYLAALDEAREFSPGDPRLARTWNNLATVYQDQGRYAEAEPLLLRAAAFWERYFGPEYPDLATCWNNLATLYQEQGR